MKRFRGHKRFGSNGDELEFTSANALVDSLLGGGDEGGDGNDTHGEMSPTMSPEPHDDKIGSSGHRRVGSGHKRIGSGHKRRDSGDTVFSNPNAVPAPATTVVSPSRPKGRKSLLKTFGLKKNRRKVDTCSYAVLTRCAASSSVWCAATKVEIR